MKSISSFVVPAWVCNLPFLILGTNSHITYWMTMMLCSNVDIWQGLLMVFCNFGNIDPLIHTFLFDSDCLSLYGSCLWKLSFKSLRSLEVAFNKCLRKIWRLPYDAHTGIFFTVLLVFRVCSLWCVCVLIRFQWRLPVALTDLLILFSVRPCTSAILLSDIIWNMVICSQSIIRTKIDPVLVWSVQFDAVPTFLLYRGRSRLILTIC